MAGWLSPHSPSVLQLTTLISILVSITGGTLSLQFNVPSNDTILYRFSSSETSPDTTQFGTVACTEAGGGALTGDVVYVISDNHLPSLPFQLDQQTGELTLASGNTLDFETIPHYLFNVSCNYVSQPTITASATVEFSVLPVNEFLPDIQNTFVSITITEATPVDTILASADTSGTVQYIVTDRDSGYDGELRFLAGSNNPAGFSIDEMTGAITLTQSLDLDTSNVPAMRLPLLIGVCDGDRVRSECPNQEISVIVIPSNDNVPQFEQNEYEISFSEGTPVGSSLIDIVCSDDDRFVGVFRSISIVPINGPLHIPNTANGTVILRQPLDYESGSTLTVSLVCKDSGFPVLQGNATLVVNIFQPTTPTSEESTSNPIDTTDIPIDTTDIPIDTTDNPIDTTDGPTSGLTERHKILVGIFAGILILLLILFVSVLGFVCCYAEYKRLEDSAIAKHSANKLSQRNIGNKYLTSAPRMRDQKVEMSVIVRRKVSENKVEEAGVEEPSSNSVEPASVDGKEKTTDLPSITP